MKKVTHENFVGIYEGYFSEEFCNNLIKHFEWCQENNRTFGRPEAESLKKDEAVCLEPNNVHEISFMFPHVSKYIEEFNTVFWDECYADYLKKYSVLADYAKHTIFTYKVQKTEPGGGYHVWHSEHGNQHFSSRVGVYLLYLNDVEEGGETEFLYFSKRIKPKKGTLLIFPPNYPWAHRGNPPLSGNKYILTGWMELS